MLLRQASGNRRPMPDEFVDSIWAHWDKGTRAAFLALYRHADPDRLAGAGRNLGQIACPSLVLWGDRDAYLPTRFADAYAERLPNAALEIVPNGGHWPWIDDARVVDRVQNFLS